MENLDTEIWISVPEAAEILGVAAATVRRRFLDSGRISVRQLPGFAPKLLKSDVVALLKSSTKMANAS